MKRYFPIFIVLFTLSSCGDAVQKPLQVKDTLSLEPNVLLDYDNAFFDDFTQGVQKENWCIANQAWGQGNGGVVPKNVHYTDDGILQLVGNGNYYAGDDIKGNGDLKDGRLTGASLISNFLTKPGRYQIKMKVLPRLGACTAFWTYAYQFNDSGDLNHEIDIELPGGNRTDTHTFQNVLNTNYHTETQSHSQDVSLKNIFDKDVTLNDGEWHVFGFDWYTDPAKIVYYVDDKITAISDFFVPNLETRLWLGVWFPVSSFVGTANFETDSMQVDWVQYIPFKDQPYTPYTPFLNTVATDLEYPTRPESLIVSDMISSGSFEYASKENAPSGWEFAKYRGGDKEIEVKDVASTKQGIGIDESYGAFVKNNGVIQQYIDSIYSNFEYDFNVAARAIKGKGKITIQYLGTTHTDILKEEVIEITSDEYQDYHKRLLAPEGCYQMKLIIDSDMGSEMHIDNLSMVRSRSE